MAQRKKKNTITEIAVPISAFILVWCILYPDMLKNSIKILFLILFAMIILFIFYKIIYKNKPPSASFDPFQVKPIPHSINHIPRSDLVDHQHTIDVSKYQNNERLSFISEPLKPEEWSRGQVNPLANYFEVVRIILNVNQHSI